MNEAQRMVEEFHRATGATIGDTPGIRDAVLRCDLIAEELDELRVACGMSDDASSYEPPNWHVGGTFAVPPDMVAAIDALCDLLYVVYGAAVTFGVDLEPFFAEVHRSNLSKVGGPVREDGKRLKPDTYEPPRLGPILNAQRSPHQLLSQFRSLESALEIDRRLFTDADALSPCPCFTLETEGFTAEGHCWRSCTHDGCCVHVTGDRAVAERLKELLDAMDWYGEWTLVFEENG